jgi:PAS domain S-box-containing protein
MINLKHLSIRQQLLCTFGTLCAILVAVGGMQFFSLRSVEDSNRRHQMRALSRLSFVDSTSREAAQMQAGVLRQVLASDQGEIKTLDQAIRELSKTNLTEIAEYRESFETADERQLYDNIVQTRKEYWRQTELVLALGVANRDTEARALINSKQDPAYDDFMTAVSKLTALVKAEADEAIRETAGFVSAVKIIGDILVGTAILVLFGAGFSVAGVARRLEEDNDLLQAEIRERIGAEERLRQAAEAERLSEARFSCAFEYAPIGMSLSIPGGPWVKVNRAFCDLVGYSEAELLVRTFRDITHPEDIEQDLIRMGRLMAGEACSYQREKRYIHARGHIVTILLNISLVRDSEAQPIYVVAQMQDITERKKAETALKESELRYHSLFENLLEGCARCRLLLEPGQPPDFIHLEVNDAFETLTGLKNVVGKRISEVIPGVHEANPAFLEGCKRVVLTGKAEKFETYSNRLGFWFSVSIHSYEGEHFVMVFDNITERKRVEDTLRESEVRFSGAFEHAPNGMALVSPEGRWLKVNRALCESVGYSEAALLKLRVQDITHPEDVEIGLEYLCRCIAGEISSFQLKKRYLHHGGRIVKASLNASLVRGEQGHPLYFIAQIQDITESERTDETVRRLAAIVEHSNDAIISKSLAGIVTSWNPAAEKMFGYTAAEIIGQPLLLLIPRDRPEEESKILAGFLKGEPVRHLETVRVRKDGRHFDVAVTISPIKDSSGTIIGASKIIRDITARKRAENELYQSRETLRGILDHIPQRVFWKDLNSVFLGCNHGCALDLGYSDASEVIGTTDYDASCRDVAALYRADDRKVMELDQAKISFEEPGFAADGSPRWLRTSKTPLHDQNGRVTGVLGTYEDVTEYKLAKLEIERLNAELEQRVAMRTEDLFAVTQEAERANRSKSEFLSRTSHELRTPLNAILGFSQLMEREGRAPEDADNIQQILKAGRHLLDLVNEVLDISSLEGGGVKLDIRSLTAGETMRDALAAAGPLAAEREVALSALACESRVLSDGERLKQVLVHLLFNAIKYNRRGGSVTLAGEERAGFLRLAITDTGPGIAAGDIEKIFNAFERLSVAGTVEGIGLGLTISRHLVEMMGGAIGVESLPGEGSTFWIELPLDESLVAQVAPEEPPTLQNPESETPKSSTILYIDDTRGTLRLIPRILARRPTIQLVTARTLATGLEMEGECRPDLIMLNLRHAESGCIAALAALRGDPRTSQTPVAMLTAEDSPEMRVRMLAAGVRAIIPKPVEVRTFLGVVDQVLEIEPGEAGCV